MLDWILNVRQTAQPSTTGYKIMPMRAASGVHVDEDTALTFAAVYGATKAISETVAMLPWRLYEVNGESRNVLSGTPLDVLLHRKPNEYMTAFSFREYLVACALLHGNGYAEIVRANGRMGEVKALYPIHPERVDPKIDDGVLYYEVNNDDGTSSQILARDMYHLRGPTRDGIIGWSVISLARNSWGLGIAADQFSGAFLGNGGVPSLVIRETEGAPDMSLEAANNMVNSFDRRHKGASNAGKTAYLEKGFELAPAGIPQKDAQFIEQRKFSVVDVARWFRIPPHKIQSMDATRLNNIESQNIEFVTDTIQPWAERLEQEADIKLVDSDRNITKIQLNGLLRGDSAARSAYYREMWNIGVYSSNDVRRLEDENPIANGDQHFVPMNMMSLDRAARQGSTDAASAIRGVIVDAHERMIEKEQNATERASGKNQGLSEWAQGFYERHEPQMRDAVMPGAKALGEFYGIDEEKIEGIVYNHVRSHVEASMIDISAGKWDWKARIDKQASRLIAMIVSHREVKNVQ